MSIKVLVVDDSATIRAILKHTLQAQPDIEVVGEAGDPYEAREAMKALNPDVVTLDIEMPRMDGFEVASTMKNNPRMQDVPIIMITSRTGEKHRERAMGMGVERYMGKPYVEEELLDTINQLVGESIAKGVPRASQKNHAVVELEAE